MMNENLFYILLLSILAAGGVAWFTQKADAPEEIPVEVPQTVTVAAVQEAPLPNNAASISRESDGHYWTRADVDGSSLKFLVDTGASVVALTWYDAKRLRLNPEELDFDWTVTTAGGKTTAASVLIESIKIGNVEIENVEAIVMREDDLETSLLGMSFLGELYSYEFRGNTMIIRQ